MTPRKLFGAIGVFAWITTLAAGDVVRAMEPPFSPPTAVVHSEDFEGAQGVPALWQVALGTWQADGQTYNSTVAANAAVTTIFEYQTFDVAGPSTADYLRWSAFTFAARLRNQQAGATALVGLVYSYVDPSNYCEVAFSPTGLAHLRRMNQGQMETLATATYAGGGQRVWFAVEVQRTDSTVSVSVNGVPVFTEAPQPASSGQVGGGQVGFSTYNTTAKFNKVSISFPFGQQPFTENFSDGVANGFSSPEGTFVVSNGTYVDTAVHRTGRAFPTVNLGSAGSLGVFSYTVHVRMLNPYGGPGNLIGIMFDQSFDGSSYREVVFSPTGVAQLRQVNARTIEVLESAPHSVGSNTWFDVTLSVSPFGVSVNINGNHLFVHEVPLLSGLPETLALITHWTPGRFDDFEFAPHELPVPESLQTFNSPLGEGEVRSGTWDTQGGTLNNVSAGVADIVLPGHIGASTDYRYKGRLLNQYGASGNLVGLVFSYDSAEDYLEAVFSPTGQAYLNLTMEGTRYRLATGTHTVPRNVGFDVEILRKGTTATVTVNGKPTFQNVQVGQLGGGLLGVVSHWAKGRFDNLATKEVP
jgi:hypothetical protein